MRSRNQPGNKSLYPYLRTSTVVHFSSLLSLLSLWNEWISPNSNSSLSFVACVTALYDGESIGQGTWWALSELFLSVPGLVCLIIGINPFHDPLMDKFTLMKISTAHKSRFKVLSFTTDTLNNLCRDLSMIRPHLGKSNILSAAFS